VSGIVTLTQDTGYIYIEDENRISGIRIQTPNQDILPGDKVYAWGVVRTDANAERYLEKLVISTSGKGVVAPLCLTNKSLGGGAFGNVSEGKGQRGVTGGTGLNNIGLLVRTTGVCSFINEHKFRLNDGSGVVVLCETPPGITVSPAWQHVVVTGISSIQKNGDNYERLLKVRSIDYNIEMIDIPTGSFLMGNNGSESYSYPSELPQHSVYLSEYSISKYQITRGQYRAFMDAGGYTNPAYWSLDGWNWRLSANSFYPEVGPPRIQPSYWAARQSWGGGGVFSQTDDHPVVGVSYYEAEAFCNWAGGCLPTEAQWEKAARWTGSSPNVYPWGNVWDAEKCNNYYDHNPAGGGYFRFQTAPVGSYPAGISPYGCHDMAGNIWEWCKDWYSDSYYSESPTGGWVDPRGPESGSSRSHRGGYWYGDENDCRCAYRRYNDPDYSYYSLGFRLARKAR
jgi:formylglycine-generating enzyme required for sulfatase activity